MKKLNFKKGISLLMTLLILVGVMPLFNLSVSASAVDLSGFYINNTGVISDSKTYDGLTLTVYDSISNAPYANYSNSSLYIGNAYDEYGADYITFEPNDKSSFSLNSIILAPKSYGSEINIYGLDNAGNEIPGCIYTFGSVAANSSVTFNKSANNLFSSIYKIKIAVPSSDFCIYTLDITGNTDTAPTVSDKAITPSDVTQTGATLNWNKATDDVTLQSSLQYLVYRSSINNLNSVAEIEAYGTAIGSYASDISSKSITGLTAGTPYYFNVIVTDGVGNKSCYTALSVTTSSAVGGWIEENRDIDGFNYNITKNVDGSFSPSVVRYNGKWYASWLERDSNNNNQVRVAERQSTGYWNFIDGGGTAGINVKSAKTASYLKLAVYNGKLYAIWSELSVSSFLLRAARYDGGSSWVMIDSGGLNYNSLGSACYTSVASDDSGLYVAWSENDSSGGNYQLRVSKYDGSSWRVVGSYTTTGLNYNTAQMVTGTSIAAAGAGKLYIVWNESGNLFARYYNGTSWSSELSGCATGLEYNTSAIIGNYANTVFYNGALYVAWDEVGSDNISKVRVKKYNGSWSSVDGGGLNYDNSKGGFSVTMTADINNLYVGWSEESLPVSQLRVKSYNPAAGWKALDSDGISSGNDSTGLNMDTTRSLFNYKMLGAGDGKLCAVFFEKGDSDTYQIQFKEYDPSFSIPSDSDKLSNLTVSTGTLYPSFNSSVYNYTILVDKGTTSVDISPVLAQNSSVLMYKGSVVTGTPFKLDNLKTGDNYYDLKLVTYKASIIKHISIRINRAVSATQRMIMPSTDSFYDDFGSYADSDSNGEYLNWVGYDADWDCTNSSVMKFDYSFISNAVTDGKLYIKINNIINNRSSENPFTNLYGSNDTSWTDKSYDIPSKDVKIIENDSTGISVGSWKSIDIYNSYIKNLTSKTATLIMTGNTAATDSCYFTFYSAESFADKPYILLSFGTPDSTAPSISSVSGNPDSWQNSDVTLTVNAADSGSGIASTNGYSFDNGVTWQNGNSKTFTTNQDNIIIKVKDNVGNTATYSTPINITKIDKTGPSITVSGNPTSWQNTPATLTVSATDSESGVATTIGYSFDGGTTWQDGNCKTYSANENNIIIKVKDIAGNITTYSPAVNITYIDNTVPTGEIKLNSESWKEFVNNITFGVFCKDTVTVTITGADVGGSGIRSIEYIRSNVKLSETEVRAQYGWVTYSTEFMIPAIDTNKFVYYVRITDNVGNIKYISSDGRTFDIKAPTISTNYVKSASSMEVTVVDTGSGIGTVTYFINGGSDIPATPDINGKFTIPLTEGKYDVVINAYDKLGNVSSQKVSVTSVYTVTFKLFNGDTGDALKTEQVEYGSGASAPANPTRIGFGFNGWDKAFSSITADTTVNALWYISGVLINPYHGVYDSLSHDAVSITGTLTGDIISYSTDGTNFYSSMPKYTYVGSYTIRVKVERAGYTPFTGNVMISISRAQGTISIINYISKTYDGTAVSDPPIVKNSNGAVSFTYYSDDNNSIGTALSGAPKDAGTYWVKAVLAEDTNYTSAEASLKFTVAKADMSGTVSIPTSIMTGSTVNANVTGVLPSVATFGYEWKLNGTVVSTDSSYAVKTADYGKTLTLVLNANENYTGSIESNSVVINENVSPAGEIMIGTTSWKEFLNDITFGVFFKDTVSVTITAADEGGSGIKSIQYYKSNVKLTVTEIKALTTWSTYTESISLTPNDAEKFVFYVKIIDNAGNLKYISSDGRTFDTQAPSITTNYTKDATSMEVTIADTGAGIGAVSYTVNGGSATAATPDASGKFSISLFEGKYDVVITAQDKLGNSRNLTVNVVSVNTVYFKLFEGDTGEALKTESVEYGSGATAPADPTRTGFTFLCWDRSFDNITVDTTVNARWEISGITVTLYTGVYDNVSHDAVTVSGTLAGDIISYGTDGINFNSALPKYTNAGIYPIYVKVERTGYSPWVSKYKYAEINCAQGSISITNDISKTYDGNIVSNPTVATNGSGAVAFSYYLDYNNSLDTTSPIFAPKDAGTYWVEAVMQDTNYTFAKTSAKFTISRADMTGTVSIPTTIMTGSTVNANTTGVLPSGVTFGYEWKLNGTTVSSDSNYVVKAADYGKTLTLVLYANDNYTGFITSNSVVIGENVAPTGEIKIGTASWKEFLNDITFGVFFKDTVSVTITAADEGGSLIKSIQYYKSNIKLTESEVKALTTWETYSSTLSLKPTDAERFVFYVKITDNAGNTKYISSDGRTFDTQIPSITTNYTKDATSMEVTIADTGAGIGSVSYMINGGSAIAATPDASGKFSITLPEGKYDVVISAQDKIGNPNSLTVNVVSVYTVTFKLFAGDTGAALKTESVEYGSGATAPADPTRTGFAFVCWDKSFDNITVDTTVSARWNIAGITVTPYTGIYDNASHDAVTITGTLSGDIVSYSTNGTDFSSTLPKNTDTGTYPVYVKVERTGYTPWVSEVKNAAISRAQGTVTITNDISKTYDGTAVLNPAVTKNGSGAVTFNYYSDNNNSIGTALSGAPKDAGTYWVKASMEQDKNYTSAEAPTKFTISKAAMTGTASIPASIMTGSTVNANVTGVLPSGVTFGYEWKLNGTVVSTDSSYAVKAADYRKTLKLVITANGNFTGSIESNSVVINENVAPTGEIKIGTASWKEFLNDITFGVFFKDTVSVTITAADEGGSSIKSIQYYKSNVKLTDTEVNALTTWSTYTDPISLTPTDAEKFVFYVKITDNAGNVKYISSDGRTFDTQAPSITTNYTKDATSMEVTVADTGAGIGTVSYTVNGSSATAVTPDANGKFSITLAEGKYDVIITAQDKIGNSKNLTVNVVSVYTVTFKLLDGDTGNALKTEQVEYGSGATAPTNPTRTGFDFNGWDKAFDSIKADTVVNALWNIAGVTVTPYNGEYDNTPHDAVTVTGTLAGDIVSYSTDGTIFKSTLPKCTNSGTYPVYVKVERTGYTPWVSEAKNAVINKKVITADMIADIPSVEYTSQPFTPQPEVKYNSITLAKDKDYSIGYANNTEVGSASVIITGNGNYSGEAVKKFAIYEKKAEVKVEDNQTPKVTVDGLDDLYEDKTVYTNDDKKIEQNGGSVKIEMSVKLKTEETEDNSKIESIAKDKTIGVYLDLSLNKTVTMSGETNGTTTKITHLDDLLEITIPIPDNIKGKPGIALFRVHNGIASAVPVGKDYAVDGEYCVISGDTIILYVRNFSTYAIGFDYKNGGKTKTGDSSMALTIFSLMIGFSTLTVAVYSRRKKRVK